MEKLKTKKVIIFDLDGTIIDLNVNWDRLKALLSERYSNKYSNASCSFESISECLSYIVERKDEPELKNFFDIIRIHELSGVPSSTPIKEVVYFIKNAEKYEVSSDTKLAIFSLNTRACIEESMKLIGIIPFIDFYVGREDVRNWKPDPEGLLKIKEHFGVKTDEMVYFGDMKKDIEAGEQASIDSFYVDELINLVRTQ